LRIRAELNRGTYPAGVKVSKDQMDELRLVPAIFHGDWNYTIAPN
jgi:hypothetical protein